MKVSELYQVCDDVITLYTRKIIRIGMLNDIKHSKQEAKTYNQYCDREVVFMDVNAGGIDVVIEGEAEQ